MTEWKLWEGDEPPVFTTPGFFEAHPHIPGEHQVGYFERLELVASMVDFAILRLGGVQNLRSLTDLGCGDGTLLMRLRDKYSKLKMWGYDLGRGNVAIAQGRGLDVQRRDLLDDDLFIGEMALVTEVLEHMVDPHRFLQTLRADYLIATSPARESAEWHYEHHAWAWDQVGFHTMIRDAGWRFIDATIAFAKDEVVFPPSGESKQPYFQCVFAARSDRI